MENKNDHHTFADKKLIFKEGEMATKLYIVKSGQVVCLKSSKDRLIPVFVAKAQDIIGESAMMAKAPYTYSAIAMSSVELISIENSEFRNVLDIAPQWLSDLTMTMVSRFQNTSGLIAENRVFHSAIISEENFSSELEVDYKKILNQ